MVAAGARRRGGIVHHETRVSEAPGPADTPWVGEEWRREVPSPDGPALLELLPDDVRNLLLLRALRKGWGDGRPRPWWGRCAQARGRHGVRGLGERRASERTSVSSRLSSAMPTLRTTAPRSCRVISARSSLSSLPSPSWNQCRDTGGSMHVEGKGTADDKTRQHGLAHQVEPVEERLQAMYTARFDLAGLLAAGARRRLGDLVLLRRDGVSLRQFSGILRLLHRELRLPR